MTNEQTVIKFQRAIDLAESFNANGNDVEVGVGNHDGWGWADVVLASRCPLTLNPYEYAAFDDSRRDEYNELCAAVENGDDEAREKLIEFLNEYEASF